MNIPLTEQQQRDLVNLKTALDELRVESSLYPSRELSLGITKLEECIMWLEKRKQN